MFCDVTDRASVDEAVARTEWERGGLDILVSNAGICPFVEFLDLDNAIWQKTIDVILTGSFNAGQAAAKSGERMLMATMSVALGKHGITVNAVAPGVIYTEMGKTHWDVPADIANAALFLALDESEYVTGSTIRVDGGEMAIGWVKIG